MFKIIVMRLVIQSAVAASLCRRTPDNRSGF
jgi:hypothetical protein